MFTKDLNDYFKNKDNIIISVLYSANIESLNDVFRHILTSILRSKE